MTAIILAAGFSKRFGGKKLLAEINRKPMFLHIIDTVLKLRFDKTILVYHDEEVKAAAADRQVESIHNPLSAEGMSTSVRCGVQHAGSTDGYMFFMADQPFIDIQTIGTLCAAFNSGEGSIIVPRYGGRNGSPVIFSSVWREKLLSVTGDAGGRGIIAENPGDVCFVDISDPKVGMDIDTYEQYIEQSNK